MTNNESLYVANKIAASNDLVTEILLRLPVRSLLRFKSVSKHWYSLITSPSFKRMNPDPPSGLFVRKDYQYLGYDFVPFDIHNPVKLQPIFKPLNNINRTPKIQHSCNGLILCSCTTSNFIIIYYVYNPTISRCTTIPNPKYLGLGFDMALAFDPLKSPHYRVVYVYHHFGRDDDYNCRIDIYSSETRTFKTYKLSFYKLADIDFETRVYCNNTIHWVNHSGFVSYFKLDQEGGINQIQTPFGLLRLTYDRDYASYIFESRGHLLLVEIERPHTSKFKIQELNTDYSAWFVKYQVDLEELGRSFPAITRIDYSTRFVKYEFVVLSLVLGEKEDDSFLVLEIPDKAVVRFNLVSKTFHKLHHFISSRPLEYDRKLLRSLQWPNVYPFMESIYML